MLRNGFDRKKMGGGAVHPRLRVLKKMLCDAMARRAVEAENRGRGVLAVVSESKVTHLLFVSSLVDTLSLILLYSNTLLRRLCLCLSY